MNINALLSPDSASSSDASTPPSTAIAGASQRKSLRTVRPAGGGKRTSSSLSQEVTRSPERDIRASNNVPRPADGGAVLERVHGGTPLQPISETGPAFRLFQQQQTLPPTSDPSPAPPDSSGRYGHSQSPSRPLISPRASSRPHLETLPGEFSLFVLARRCGLLTYASRFQTWRPCNTATKRCAHNLPTTCVTTL